MREHRDLVNDSEAIIRELRKSPNMVLKAFGGHLFKVAQIVEKIRKDDEGDAELTPFDYAEISELIGVKEITDAVYDSLTHLRKTMDLVEAVWGKQVEK